MDFASSVKQKAAATYQLGESLNKVVVDSIEQLAQAGVRGTTARQTKAATAARRELRAADDADRTGHAAARAGLLGAGLARDGAARAARDLRADAGR